VKIGDLVKDNHPSWMGAERVGMIVGRALRSTLGASNRTFRVLWRNGTIGNNVWDYDLKVISESRRPS